MLVPTFSNTRTLYAINQHHLMKRIFQVILIIFELSSASAFCQDTSNKDSVDRQAILKFFNDYSQNLRQQEKKVQDTILMQRNSYKNSYQYLISHPLNYKHILLFADTLYQSAENVFRYLETFEKTLPSQGSTATVALWVDLRKACTDTVFINHLTKICVYAEVLLHDNNKKSLVDSTLSYFKLIPHHPNWFQYFNWGWLELARPDIEKRISRVVSMIFDEIKKSGLDNSVQHGVLGKWGRRKINHQ